MAVYIYEMSPEYVTWCFSSMYGVRQCRSDRAFHNSVVYGHIPD
jgi:hypothetical protein